MRNMAFTLAGDLLLGVFGAEPPVDSEWELFLAVLQAIPAGRARVLTFSLGGGPGRDQRLHLRELLRGRSLPLAMITRSPLARAAVSALAWFDPEVRAFPPEELDDALTFLALPAGERNTLLRTAERLLLAVDPTSSRALERLAP